MSLEQYKDASRKELWDILQIQMQVLQAETAKVAELEKEANNTKGLWVTSNDLQAWKLEQQAKGVEGYIAMRKLAGGSYCSTTLMYIDELYEQAKALKESK
tara:strand:+ start:138 stop:440 length:303 start_codon:yes stop_codon:yes gene_type:complete